MKSMPKDPMATHLPKNSKGGPIASPAHQSVTGNKAGSKMKLSDIRQSSSKR